MDSLYNEHLLTINQQQDEITMLKRQISVKQNELIGKDRIICELKSDIIDIETGHKNDMDRVIGENERKIDNLMDMIRKLQHEKATIAQSMKKRRSNSNLHSMSAANLQNPLRLTPLRIPSIPRPQQNQPDDQRSSRSSGSATPVPQSDDDESNGLLPPVQEQRSPVSGEEKPNSSNYDNKESENGPEEIVEADPPIELDQIKEEESSKSNVKFILGDDEEEATNAEVEADNRPVKLIEQENSKKEEVSENSDSDEEQKSETLQMDVKINE